MGIVESLFSKPVWSKQDHVAQIKYETLIKEFVQARDEFGSTALHYAFYKHNFELIEFIHNYLDSNQTSTILPSFEHQICVSKDGSGQTAFSLVYWQVGRITYSKGMKINKHHV